MESVEYICFWVAGYQTGKEKTNGKIMGVRWIPCLPLNTSLWHVQRRDDNGLWIGSTYIHSPPSAVSVTLPIRRLLVSFTPPDTLSCDCPPSPSFSPLAFMEPPPDDLPKEEPGGVATAAADDVEDILPQATGKRRKRKRKRKGCSSQPSTSATSDAASAPEDHTASKRAKLSHGKSPVHILLVL